MDNVSQKKGVDVPRDRTQIRKRLGGYEIFPSEKLGKKYDDARRKKRQNTVFHRFEGYSVTQISREIESLKKGMSTFLYWYFDVFEGSIFSKTDFT